MMRCSSAASNRAAASSPHGSISQPARSSERGWRSSRTTTTTIQRWLPLPASRCSAFTRGTMPRRGCATGVRPQRCRWPTGSPNAFSPLAARPPMPRCMWWGPTCICSRGSTRSAGAGVCRAIGVRAGARRATCWRSTPTSRFIWAAPCSATATPCASACRATPRSTRRSRCTMSGPASSTWRAVRCERRAAGRWAICARGTDCRSTTRRWIWCRRRRSIVPSTCWT